METAVIPIHEQAARHQLESMRTELLGRLGQLASGYPADHRPAGARTRFVNGVFVLMPHTLGILEQVEVALRQLDQGQYGVCRACGRDIRFDRLKALPYATQCIECSLKRAET